MTSFFINITVVCRLAVLDQSCSRIDQTFYRLLRPKSRDVCSWLVQPRIKCLINSSSKITCSHDLVPKDHVFSWFHPKWSRVLMIQEWRGSDYLITTSQFPPTVSDCIHRVETSLLLVKGYLSPGILLDDDLSMRSGSVYKQASPHQSSFSVYLPFSYELLQIRNFPSNED